MTAHSKPRRGTNPKPLETPTEPAITQSWFIDPYLANIGILVLDYQSLELKTAHFTKQEPCSSRRQPVSEEELISRAAGIFNAVGKSWSQRVIPNANGQEREELDIHIRFAGDLALLEIPPGDFGGFAVSHRCSGLVLYAGSILWAGLGEQLYPANPIIFESLSRKPTTILPPQEIDVLIGPQVSLIEDQSGIEAWHSIQDLNLVKSLTMSPYDVFVYLYPRTVGDFDPDKAVWVIFVNQYPTQ